MEELTVVALEKKGLLFFQSVSLSRKVQRFPFLFNIFAKVFFQTFAITKSGAKIGFFVLKQKEKKMKKKIWSFN